VFYLIFSFVSAFFNLSWLLSCASNDKWNIWGKHIQWRDCVSSSVWPRNNQGETYRAFSVWVILFQSTRAPGTAFCLDIAGIPCRACLLMYSSRYVEKPVQFCFFFLFSLGISGKAETMTVTLIFHSCTIWIFQKASRWMFRFSCYSMGLWAR